MYTDLTSKIQLSKPTQPFDPGDTPLLFCPSLIASIFSMLTSFTSQSVPDRGSGLSIILGMLRPRPVRTFTFLVMITAKAFSQASTLLLISRRRPRVRNLSRSSITPTCRAAAPEAQQISPQPIVMLLQQPRICARSHDCHVLFALRSALPPADHQTNLPNPSISPQTRGGPPSL